MRKGSFLIHYISKDRGGICLDNEEGIDVFEALGVFRRRRPTVKIVNVKRMSGSHESVDIVGSRVRHIMGLDGKWQFEYLEV